MCVVAAGGAAELFDEELFEMGPALLGTGAGA